MQSSSGAESLNLFLVGLVITLWICWIWTRRNLYKFALNFPGLLGLPLSGSLLNIRSTKNLLKFFEAAFRKCKSYTLCFWLGPSPMLLTADPHFIEKLILSPDMQNKAELIYKPIFNAFKGGIVASGGEKWYKNRKLINPAFSRKVLVSFLPVFHKASGDVKNTLEKLANDGIAHDVFSIFQRMTFIISVETTMGVTDHNAAQSEEELISIFQYVLDVTSAQMVYCTLHLGGIFKFHYKLHKRLKTLYDYVWKLIEHKLNNDKGQNQSINTEYDDSKKNGNIFIDQAVEIFRRKQFTINDIIAESHTIVAAAAETTATALYSTVVLLAMHPEIQERLYEEISSFYPTKEFEVQYEDFEQLPYLGMVINEVLRLTPSVPMVGRHVVKDTRIGKHLILPKGLQVLISIFHLHRRKDIWGENAEKFDPERFLPENVAKLHPYAYIPFSKGSRNCIGWRYALFSLKVALSHFVRNFRFETDTKLEQLQFGENIALSYLIEPKIRIYKRI